MTPVDQTVYTVPGGNCFSACVASIMELPLDEVPYFMGDFDEADHGAWWDRFCDWLAPRGWKAWFCVPGENVERDVWPDEPYIASGQSPRDTPEGREGFLLKPWPVEWGPILHSVVMESGLLAHDPHPSRAGIVGEVVDFVLLRRVA